MKNDIFFIFLMAAFAIIGYYNGDKKSLAVGPLLALTACAFSRNTSKIEVNSELGLDNNRHSVINFYGKELDRAAVFFVLAHTRKLVAKIAPEIKMEEFEEGD